MSLDQLVFSVNAMLEVTAAVEATKKVVLNLVGQNYDSLEFLSTVNVCFRILMQELCENKLGWEQLLNGNY